jgi:hypothetical protein
MTAIRMLGFSALVLAAFAGCTNEPEATTSTTPAPATSASSESTPATAAPADMPKGEASEATPATTSDAKPEEAKPEGKGAAVSLSADEVAEVKQLPAGEAEQALQQLVCPVSGENLGSMGKPVKVTAEGQTFFLCCKGCSSDVKENPAAVIAKLKKK